MLWNRFCPGFPLRFGFCFRQPVGCLFCQMVDFLHGMVGGVRDLAALIAIFRLPTLCCVTQLLPKLLKGSIRAAAERCLRRGLSCIFQLIRLWNPRHFMKPWAAGKRRNITAGMWRRNPLIASWNAS